MYIFPFSPKVAMLARPTPPERKCTSENDGVTMTIAFARTYARLYRLNPFSVARCSTEEKDSSCVREMCLRLETAAYPKLHKIYMKY